MSAERRIIEAVAKAIGEAIQLLGDLDRWENEGGS